MKKALETMLEASERHLQKIADEIDANNGDFVSSRMVDDAMDLLRIHCKAKEMLKLV